MARKRSLKDAAADQLVEKNKTVSEAALPPPRKPAARRRPVKTAEPEPAAEALPVPEAPPVSDHTPVLPEPSKAPEENQPERSPLLWVAVALLIGCVGGYFFGVGQAIGPANMAFILIGFAGGYLCGRFLKLF